MLAQDAPVVDMAHPAHIHSGTCDELGDVVFPLAEVRAPVPGGTPIASPEPAVSLEASPAPMLETVGESYTVLEVPIDEILAEEHAINVHQSEEEIDTYIACGNVTGEPTNGTLTFELEELNESGYSGQATLLDNEDGTTTVLLTLAHDDVMATPAA